MDPTANLATSLGLQGALAQALDFVALGGPAMWAIALLSVATLALILWKVMQLLAFGAWSGGRHTGRALDLWTRGDRGAAMAALAGRSSLRARHALGAMQAASNPGLDREGAEAEATRIGRGLLVQARAGLRGLELAATVGPLLGLLGTVTGMIGAFQALQEAGSRADPAALAGGIWEALLTTAAGMAVAIPAQMALAWFDSVVDHLAEDMEDATTRILHAPGLSRPVAPVAARDTEHYRAAE
jgi:biopolymer transport protein ExbB